MFLHLLVFFFNWRPSQNTINYDTKPIFSFFALFIFFEKKLKNECQTGPPKKQTSKNAQLGPKMDPQIMKIEMDKS